MGKKNTAKFSLFLHLGKIQMCYPLSVRVKDTTKAFALQTTVESGVET